MENFWGQVKETTTRIVKNVTKKIVKVILPVVVIAGVLFTLLSGCTYEVTKQDAGYQEGNPANVPYAVSQFMSNITIDAEGNITSSQTVGELWNYLVLNNSKIEQYLNGPEDLLKLINAELVTSFPDMRSAEDIDNPDNTVDWDFINRNYNLNELYGIVKFKRAKSDGSVNTISYVDKNTYYGWIDEYNNGNTAVIDDIYNHFTLEATQVVTNSNNTTGTDTSNNNTTSGTSTTNNINTGTTNTTTSAPITSTANMQLISDSGRVTFYSGAESEGGAMNAIDYALTDGQCAFPLAVFQEYKNSVIYIETTTEGEGSHANGRYFYVTDTDNGEWLIENQVDVYVPIDPSQNQVLNSAPYGQYDGAKIYLVEQNVSFEDFNSKYLGQTGITQGTGTTTKYNVVVGNLNTNSSTPMTTETIDYQSLLSGYTMPFDYLWALVVTGQSPTFPLEVADLVFGSDIEITILDNTTTTTTEESSIRYITDSSVDPPRESNHIGPTTTSSSEVNRIDTAIKANVWIVDYNESYTYVPGTPSTTTDRDSETFTNGPVTTNLITTYETTVTSQSYRKVKGEPQEKVDPNSTEDNFVTLLKKPDNSLFLGNITGSSWLLEILADNPKTVDMVDLTKYLLYMATGYSKYESDYDFSQFKPENFTTVGANSGSVGWEFTKSWENTPLWNYLNGNGSYSSAYVTQCITADNKYYIMHDDLYTDNGNRNFGFGVCFYKGGSGFQNTSYFTEQGINITDDIYQQYGVSTLEVEIVDRISYQIWSEYRNRVQVSVNNAGLQLESYQIDCLTDLSYQGWHIWDVLQAYKQYGMDETQIRAASSGFDGDRGEARWILFSTGQYTTADGQVLDPNAYATSSSDFLNVAREVWIEVSTSGRFPSYGGSSIPCTGPTIDCSSYVSWVLYEYGYEEFAPYQKSTGTFLNTDWNKAYGWTEIPVGSGENPIDILQPGDIFVRYGNGTHHVTIVAEIRDGRMYCYDCGSSSANWNESGGNPIDKTYFLTKSGQGKIIRVTPPTTQ